MSIFLVTATHI